LAPVEWEMMLRVHDGRLDDMTWHGRGRQSPLHGDFSPMAKAEAKAKAKAMAKAMTVGVGDGVWPSGPPRVCSPTRPRAEDERARPGTDSKA